MPWPRREFWNRARLDIRELDQKFGGDGGIRTLDTPLRAYNGLANRRLQPLGHVSGVRFQALSIERNSPKPQNWHPIGTQIQYHRSGVVRNAASIAFAAALSVF